MPESSDAVCVLEIENSIEINLQGACGTRGECSLRVLPEIVGQAIRMDCTPK